VRLQSPDPHLHTRPYPHWPEPCHRPADHPHPTRPPPPSTFVSQP